MEKSRARSIQPKVSRNLGLKLNGSVVSNQKSFEKASPPLRWTFFLSWAGPIENWAFHLTDPFSIPVPRGILSMFNMEENTYQCSFCGLITAQIGVTHTYMYTHNRLAAASQTKCMFWLLKTVYSWENFECSFGHSKVVWSQPANICDKSAQNELSYGVNFYAWNSSHNIISW